MESADPRSIGMDAAGSMGSKHIPATVPDDRVPTTHADSERRHILRYNERMSDFLDRLPSKEQEKIRKRLRSPEAYERLREKVKGPEDLEREMDRSEKLAELHLAIESDPAAKERLRASMEKDLREQGVEAVLEAAPSPEAAAALESGRFTVSVEAHPQTQEDALVVLPEGNVQERIPVKQSFSERYSGQILGQR